MDRKEASSVAAFRTIDERFAAIRELAYRLWEDRGRPDGSPADDWYKAELTIDRGEDRHGATRATVNFPAMGTTALEVVTSAAQPRRSKGAPKGAKPATQP